MQNKPARCGNGLENRVSLKSDGVRVLCSAPHAGLTQLVEYLFCNQTARGSSPRFSTNGDDVGKSYSMRTPQRSSRLANPCTPLTEVPNAGPVYAAYHKGSSFQSKANSQVQALHAATIDILLRFSYNFLFWKIPLVHARGIFLANST